MADDNERLKLWLGFWRVVIVSGIVGAIGIIVPPWINAEIQSKELGIAKTQKDFELEIVKNEKEAEILAKRLDLEQKYVSTFLERATEENVENRYRFTRYLSALTLDPSLKIGWTELFNDANEERTDKKNRLKELEGKETKEAKAEISRLQRELDAKSDQRDLVFVETVDLSKLNDGTECPAGATARISAIEKLSQGAPTEQLAHQEAGESNWSSRVRDFISKVFGGRRYNLISVCISDSGQFVGHGTVFRPDGEIDRRISSKDLLAAFGGIAAAR